MIKLEDSMVRRGGATSPYLDIETKIISFSRAFRGGGWSFDFSIASKGGGITVIELTLSPNDMPKILREILTSNPAAACWFIDLANEAVQIESDRLKSERDKLQASQVAFSKLRKQTTSELDEILNDYDSKLSKIEHTPENFKTLMVNFISAIKKRLYF